MDFAFTDVSATAGWRGTWLASPPWRVVPHYSQMLGFCLSMVVPDLLHCWNLGVARDVLGSALKIILSQRIVFDAPRLEDRMLQATESVRSYAKQHRYHLRLRKFTKAKLQWSSKGYPELGCSGYDAFVVGSWLEYILEDHSNVYSEISTLLWSSNRAVSLMYSADRYLTLDEKNNLKELGGLFVRTYLHLACEARRNLQYLWRVKPKLHLLCHIFQSARVINQARYSTWLDEDFLKKVGRTLRLSPVKGAQHRMLQRWLLSLPLHFQKNLPKV